MNLVIVKKKADLNVILWKDGKTDGWLSNEHIVFWPSKVTTKNGASIFFAQMVPVWKKSLEIHKVLIDLAKRKFVNQNFNAYFAEHIGPEEFGHVSLLKNSGIAGVDVVASANDNPITGLALTVPMKQCHHIVEI